MNRILLLVVTLALTACSAEYDHIAQTEVSGIIIRVDLKHSHPFLAEYKKFLEVEYAGSKKKKEIFQDTGGYAWVALNVEHGALEVRDLDGLQYSIPLRQNAEAPRRYLGRFDFDQKRTYRFIPASEDPHEPPVNVLKK
jgi:hypothetical protein